MVDSFEEGGGEDDQEFNDEHDLKLTRRLQQQYKEQPKEYVKSYVFTMIAALGFGLANFLSEDLSRRLGVKSVYAHTFGLLITWLVYHSVSYIKYVFKDKSGSTHYFSKDKS